MFDHRLGFNSQRVNSKMTCQSSLCSRYLVHCKALPGWLVLLRLEEPFDSHLYSWFRPAAKGGRQKGTGKKETKNVKQVTKWLPKGDRNR